MVRPMTERRLTLEEYEALPDEGLYIDELSRGYLVREPDIAFVRRERLGSRKNASFFPGAPDIAIEVVSPSIRAGEILQKVSELLDAGTHIVWVVYPATHTVAEHSAGGGIRILNPEETLSAPHLLPGFEIPVARMFGVR